MIICGRSKLVTKYGETNGSSDGSEIFSVVMSGGLCFGRGKNRPIMFPGAFARSISLALFHAERSCHFSMVLFAAVLMGLATPVLLANNKFCLILGLHELIRLISGIRGKGRFCVFT